MFQNEGQLYSSSKRDNLYESSGDSGATLLGIAGSDGFRVVFQCDLTNPFKDCEGGTFEYKVVDCGCPGGAPPILDCTIRTFEVARNAVRTTSGAPFPSFPSFCSHIFAIVFTNAQQVCPPTPAPVPAPPSPSPAACFSGAATVVVKGRGAIPIADVTVGDNVQVSETEFDTVYTLAKKDSTTDTAFVQVSVQGMEDPLELTGHHLLLVNGQWTQALAVRVGDTVTTVNGSASVAAIKWIRRDGFYAPFTYSGTLMVNGVKASVFAGTETVQFGHDWVTGISLHDLLQMAMTHHRLVCRLWFDVCRAETHNEEGVSRMIAFPDRLYKWWQEQHAVLGYATLAPVMALNWVASSAESFVG